MANPKKNPNVYDTRVINRNLADGTLSADDVKRHIEQLPDVAAKSQAFETSLRGHDRDDDDADAEDEG